MTIGEQIYWSYANLARAHAALASGAKKYGRVHYAIRSKVFHGLKSGKMNVRSLYDDERLKMTLPQICVYCGSNKSLSIDHLIPRALKGIDQADNLVWACRSCNSSKGANDMLVWMVKKDKFPSIFVLRRYLKIVYGQCTQLEILDEPLENEASFQLPFSTSNLPTSFPPLERLVLWVD